MTSTVLLVGHRATGKTTLAAHLATLWPSQVEVLDLDREVEKACGEPCHAILARSPDTFRTLERRHLARLRAAPAQKPVRLIVPGAGMLDLPEDLPTVWVWRPGWAHTARRERARLRPEMTWEEEVRWMQQTREPVWSRLAHVRHTLEPGSPPRCDAQAVWEWITLLTDQTPNALAHKSWLVPTSQDSLPLDVQDVRLFGLAGLEIRSDFFDTIPPLPIPLLGSLRTPHLGWISDNLGHLAHLDVDLSLLGDDLSTLVPPLQTAAPGFPLTLSLHPQRDDLDDLNTLLQGAHTLTQRLPHLQVGVKYAPPGASWHAVKSAFEAISALGHPRLTWLPQSPEFAWLRPKLLNPLNYIQAGRLSHLGARAKGVTPLALPDWLPHIRGQTPTHFEALVGDPVAKSQGDRFHRVQALSLPATCHTSYLKIPVKKEDITHALPWLSNLGIRHLSVTSPHKTRAASLAHKHHAVNTLRWDGDRWEACDTDACGMLATLHDLEASGLPPGEVTVFGRGGVSQALLRAIKDSRWTLGAHLSARAGWPKGLDHAYLVVNASGDHDLAYTHAPSAQAWVDLHYTGVHPQPEGVLHRNGALFFAAQALAQRAFWHQTPPPPSPPTPGHDP